MLGERGITIVEVMAAAAILGLGIVGVLVVVPISSHGVQEGNQLSTATFLAEQRLEQVRNAPWSSAPENDCVGVGTGAAPTVPAGKTCTLGSTTIAAGGITFADEAAVASYAGYARTVRVQDCGAAACAGVTDADLRMVTVNVSYRPLTGTGVAPTAKTVTLTMLLSRR